MANFPFTLPSLGSQYLDYRSQVAGDSYNWQWIRPLSGIKYIVIHHSASPDTQTPEEIARYHVQTRGWGGIGYHFVISKNGTVYYVGDLNTARANVANYNHLVIGVCLIGNFTGGSIPTDAQLRSCHYLCSQLLFNTPELGSLDQWDCVVGHQQLQATTCPGDTWTTWRNRIIDPPASTTTPPPSTSTTDRTQQIADLYRIALGREPDQGGLATYVQSSLTIDQVRQSLVESNEHKLLIQKANNFHQAQTLAAEITKL